MIKTTRNIAAIISVVLLSLVSVPLVSQQIKDVQTRTLRIGVFGLFHPQALVLRPLPGQQLSICGADGATPILLTNAADTSITREGNRFRVDSAGKSSLSEHLRFCSSNSGVSDFTLSVPGKIQRRFRGQLEVLTEGPSLVPVVEMDLETAVASIVAAESPAHAPLEALKAQAVVTRSYLVANRNRHHNYDFCDTTHCQFLRDPPATNSPAFRATLESKGLVLTYKDVTVGAMFTASCGGKTRTLADVGMDSDEGLYPYYAVVCDHCQRNPTVWTVRLTRKQAEGLLHAHTEKKRLEIARRLGWNSMPGNDFVVHHDKDGFVATGKGHGHGVGLCQLGATAMAQQGKDARSILEHYFPNTVITDIPANSMNAAGK